MTDGEIEIRLHDIARTVEQYGTCNLDAKEMRLIADRFAKLKPKAFEGRITMDQMYGKEKHTGFRYWEL